LNVWAWASVAAKSIVARARLANPKARKLQGRALGTLGLVDDSAFIQPP
jgi:hypothetical protein